MSTGFVSAANRAVSLSNISGTVVNCTAADMIGVPLVTREQAGRGKKRRRKMQPEKMRRKRFAKKNSVNARRKNTPKKIHRRSVKSNTTGQYR
jgi:hypothetical protein